MHRGKIYIVLIACLAMMSCAPKALREAEEVVAQADSMRAAGQMYGIDAGDSATLAQAYETLGSLSLFNFHFSPSYAHACYHYGRLLREKDNPVEAMQCFINATHTRTHDYHILGRVYSNMGDIAHLAGEYSLSCDMFEQSADYFLQNGDTILYYYGLNSTAFVQACIPDIDSCYAILQTIENTNIRNDSLLIADCNMVRGRACISTQKYDSAIYYAHKALNSRQNDPLIIHILAQAYSFLGIKDSATCYALQLAENSPPLNELANALYILTNNDESRDVYSIRAVASARSDTQKLIEIRQGKLSQAVQLLEQDLHRKPDWRWLYAIIATLLIIGTSIGIYVYRIYNKRELLSQQVNDLLNKNDAAIRQHEQIIQEHTEYNNSLALQVENYCTILSQAEDFPNNIYWKDFDAMSKLLNDNLGMLVIKLQSIYHLSEKEVRLCVLVMMGNLNGTELADLLYYGKGIRTFKNRVAHKLGTNSTELRIFLIKLATNI